MYIKFKRYNPVNFDSNTNKNINNRIHTFIFPLILLLFTFDDNPILNIIIKLFIKYLFYLSIIILNLIKYKYNLTYKQEYNKIVY